MEEKLSRDEQALALPYVLSMCRQPFLEQYSALPILRPISTAMEDERSMCFAMTMQDTLEREPKPGYEGGRKPFVWAMCPSSDMTTHRTRLITGTNGGLYPLGANQNELAFAQHRTSYKHFKDWADTCTERAGMKPLGAIAFDRYGPTSFVTGALMGFDIAAPDAMFMRWPPENVDLMTLAYYVGQMLEIPDPFDGRPGYMVLNLVGRGTFPDLAVRGSRFMCSPSTDYIATLVLQGCLYVRVPGVPHVIEVQASGLVVVPARLWVDYTKGPNEYQPVTMTIAF